MGFTPAIYYCVPDVLKTCNARHQAAPLGARLHALVMRHFSPVVGLFNAPPLPETHCRNGRLNVPRRVGPFADNVARSDGIRGQETTNVVAGKAVQCHEAAACAYPGLRKVILYDTAFALSGERSGPQVAFSVEAENLRFRRGSEACVQVAHDLHIGISDEPIRCPRGYRLELVLVFDGHFVEPGVVERAEERRFVTS